ncbi:hypothetical protein AY599_26825 [Leptolyngbya valderiana BDU 20041]|nr:hypothetical protein [Geitlerinema sp. CS-897]OAB61918.1 hypothetical protein AY599_26825 [Leptolyngbya valderiana BDU 20041]
MKRKSKLSVFWLLAIALAAVFVVQNGAPVVALRWFGLRSLALPLGVWVVLAVLAGIFTAMLFAWLFRSSRSPHGRIESSPASDFPPDTHQRRSFTPQPSRNWVDLEPDDSGDERFQTPTVAYEPVSSSPSRPAFVRLEAEDEPDDEEEVWDDEDWEAENADYPEEENVTPQSDRAYEVQQRPVESYRQGTMYSYSYEKAPKPPPRESKAEVRTSMAEEDFVEERVASPSEPAIDPEPDEEDIPVAADWEDDTEWEDEAVEDAVEERFDDTPSAPRERDRPETSDRRVDDWTQPTRDDDRDW